MIVKSADTDPPLVAVYPWMETQAEVLSCHFRFARMHTFTIAMFSPQREFQISFTYYAHGQDFTDEFVSPDFMEQGTNFPVYYNPLNPRQNSKSFTDYSKRSSLATYGLAASVFWSLLSLVVLRGCS